MDLSTFKETSDENRKGNYLYLFPGQDTVVFRAVVPEHGLQPSSIVQARSAFIVPGGASHDGNIGCDLPFAEGLQQP